MAVFPVQNTTDNSLAGTLLVSTAIAQGITNAASLSQAALMQEAMTNLMAGPSPGNMISVSATVAWGYGTGAGGIVTQASNKTTAVVLSKPTGQIVTNSAELLPGAEAAFTVTNSLVAATDVPLIAIGAGGATGKYLAVVSAVAAGSFDITLSNASAVSLTEAVTVNFAILKGVAA